MKNKIKQRSNKRKKKKKDVYLGRAEHTSSESSDNNDGERHKEKKEPDSKKGSCPPHQGIAVEDPYVTELLGKDPKSLVEYEPNIIDQRIETGEGYTPGGGIMYMDPGEIPVEVFDPGSVPTDSSWVVFGRRRSGKSYFTRDMMYAYHKTLDHGLVMTKTKHNHFFQVVPPDTVPKKYKDDYQGGFIPDKAVISGFESIQIKNLMDFQLDLIKHEDEFERAGYKRPAFLWLDDVVDSKVIMTEGDHGILAQLFQQGRHFDIMVGINTQYPRSIPTKMRDNVDYAVIFKQDSRQEFEAIIDHYCGELNRRTAQELIHMYTKGQFLGPKQCLIINMQSGCPWEEKYKTYVANPEPPTFVVGGEKYKEQMKYQKEWEFKPRAEFPGTGWEGQVL
jgi:hypothetical protein